MSKLTETKYVSAKIENERKENGEWNRVLDFFKNKIIKVELLEREYKNKKNKEKDEQIVGKFIGTIGTKGMIYSKDRKVYTFKMCQILKITAFDVSEKELPPQSMYFQKTSFYTPGKKKNKKILEFPKDDSGDFPSETEGEVKK